MCLSISTVLCFLKDIRVDDMPNPLRKKRIKVDAYMPNLLRKKRIRIDAMPNLLLREINSLRSRCHALRLTNIKYQVMNCSIDIVNFNWVWLTVDIEALPYFLLYLINIFISSHSSQLFRIFFLNIIYQSSWEWSRTCPLFYLFDLVH
jgi:hypothetical protein